MKKMSRRELIQMGLWSGAFGVFSTKAIERIQTPKETSGPFYPQAFPKDQDFDLTQVLGKKGKAKGKIIVVYGMVSDTDGRPVEDVSVEVWQANNAGKYHHPHDNNPAPVDPNFQGWAITQTDKRGSFKFRTVYPGAYPVSRTSSRTPHIHFKVSKRGYHELVTQMYFPNEPMNRLDLLFNQKNKEERALMTAVKSGDSAGKFGYQIILSAAI